MGVRVRSAILGLAVALATANPACSGTTTNLAQIGFWTIYLYRNDDGSFGHCGMQTGSRVGSETMMITVNQSGYIIFLWDQSWTLKEGDKYNAEIDIANQTFNTTAGVVDANGIGMTIGFDTGFGHAFATGTEMNFAVGDFKRSVDLRESGAAISRLAECIKANMPSSDPFGAPVASNPFGNPTAQ